MASIRFSQIRCHPGQTLQYMASFKKILPRDQCNIYQVLRYMSSPEATTRVYSFSRNLSQNIVLAEKQLELYRERYFASKKGGIQGLAKGKQELLGLHFFISFSEHDDPDAETMTDIAMAIAQHPRLRDFAVFIANHFDQTHKHLHMYVSAYSAVGKPRKLCMRKEDLNEIRISANRLCVERGLSIIDLATLRWNNPEYSTWIDGVIAEGKVIVHPEKEGRKRKQKISTRNIYYTWKKAEEERAAEELRLMTDAQRQKHDFEERFYHTTDGDPNKRWYVSGDPKKRFYVIQKVSNDGHRRSAVELLVRFVLFIADKEGAYIKQNDPELWLKYNAHVDKALQGIYDTLQTANEMHIHSPNDITVRLSDVGMQMNALRREKRRHELSIEKHEQIIAAYQTYMRIRPLVEGVVEPDPAVLREYKEAYALLAQNQILTTEAYEALLRRYHFEQQKVIDYNKRMPLLNKRYRALKKLEAFTSRSTYIVERIYEYSEQAECKPSGKRAPAEGISQEMTTQPKADRELL